MAAEYFLYTTDYNNTLVDRSDTTFSPVPPYAEIFIDYFIPEIQPLYLYRESASTIVHNDDDTINAYLADTSPPPQPEDPIETQVFTGYTATTKQEFTGYTQITAPATYVNVTGDTMTGSLIVSGTTTVLSNLNVSGITRFGSAVYLDATPTLAYPEDYNLFWSPTTGELTAKRISGGSTNYYYAENVVSATTTQETPVKFLGYTGSSLPEGYYQVDFTEQVGQQTANRCVYGKFEIDGQRQGCAFLLKMNATNISFTNTLSRDVYLSGGTHCFDLYYWNGDGVAEATFASVRIRKV